MALWKMFSLTYESLQVKVKEHLKQLEFLKMLLCTNLSHIFIMSVRLPTFRAVSRCWRQIC